MNFVSVELNLSSKFLPWNFFQVLNNWFLVSFSSPDSVLIKKLGLGNQCLELWYALGSKLSCTFGGFYWLSY